MKDLPDPGIFSPARPLARSRAGALIDQCLAAQTVALPGAPEGVRPAMAESPLPIRRPRPDPRGTPPAPAARRRD